MDEKEIQVAAENLTNIYAKLSNKDFFLGLSGDALAYTATKVAALKGRLVEVKREAELAAKTAEMEYKAEKGLAIKRLTSGDEKVSVTAAEKMLYADDEVIAAKEKHIAAEALFNFVKSLTADGHDMVDAIRSRLIDLQGTRKDERIQ